MGGVVLLALGGLACQGVPGKDTSTGAGQVDDPFQTTPTTDTDFTNPTDPTGDDDDTTPGDDDDDTTTPTDPGDACDGIDNDGDGLIDEGHPDVDADGTADCRDFECSPVLGPGGTVPTLPECQPVGPLVVDPWLVTTEWSWLSNVEIVVTPVTGQLTDDNGDGVTDADDVVDVVFVSYVDGTVSILSGDGSGLVCDSPGWDPDGGLIVADVDGDGQNEVVGAESGADHVRAMDGDCTLEWTSSASYDLNWVVTTAADLTGDGTIEVISSNAVVDGATGDPLFELAPTNASCWPAPFAADLDQDGESEIFYGATVFAADGTPLWDAPGSGITCFGGAANLDADPEAEVFVAFGQTFSVYEHDGALVWSEPLFMPNPGPPCAGDIDGDGAVELVAPNGYYLTAFEADGTVAWEAPIDDPSGSAACSVFDLDHDGVYEVLHADEEHFRILDGRTGAARFDAGGHESVTYFEAPSVADLDGDGAAEILVARSSFAAAVSGGLVVYGHAGAGWPEAPQTWGLPDYSETNQNDDGTIPTDPVAPWLGPNVWRGFGTDGVPGRANLRAEVSGVCASSCTPIIGEVVVAVDVVNDGGADAPASTASLWSVDPGTGAEALLGTAEVAIVPSGGSVSGVTFELDVGDWTGEYVVRVDDDGASASRVDECDEADNASYGVADLCP